MTLQIIGFDIFTALESLSLLLSVALIAIFWKIPDTPLIKSAAFSNVLGTIVVLVGGSLYGFQGLHLAPYAFCQAQAMLLQFFFMNITVIIVSMCVNVFLMITKGLDREARYFKYYISVSIIFPALVVGFTYLSTVLNVQAIGYAPRSGWCFVNKPMILRIVSYTMWYLIINMTGFILMLIVAYKLWSNPSLRPLANRMILFGFAYTICSTMSYAQGTYETIKWMIHNINPEEGLIGPTEFAQACVGIGLFVVFASGGEARKVCKRWLGTMADDKTNSIDSKARSLEEGKSDTRSAKAPSTNGSWKEDTTGGSTTDTVSAHSYTPITSPAKAQGRDSVRLKHGWFSSWTTRDSADVSSYRGSKI